MCFISCNTHWVICLAVYSTMFALLIGRIVSALYLYLKVGFYRDYLVNPPNVKPSQFAINIE